MACACKVNQQLTYLQKHFGTNQVEQKKVMPSFGIMSKKITIWVILFPLMPLMLLFIIFRNIFKKTPIEMGKMFKKV